MCGHDHTKQHIIKGNLHILVSGAGSKPYDYVTNLNNMQDCTLNFLSKNLGVGILKFKKKSIEVLFFNENSVKEYNYSIFNDIDNGITISNSTPNNMINGKKRKMKTKKRNKRTNKKVKKTKFSRKHLRKGNQVGGFGIAGIGFGLTAFIAILAVLYFKNNFNKCFDLETDGEIINNLREEINKIEFRPKSNIDIINDINKICKNKSDKDKTIVNYLNEIFKDFNIPIQGDDISSNDAIGYVKD